jgi:haloalkane dehalogenase
MKARLLVVILSLTGIESFSQTYYSTPMDQLESYDNTLFPFESKWMDINGNKIHYIDEGTGQILVFSHAVVGSSFMYREFVKQLRDEYRVVIMDFPGFGLSQQSGEYQFTFVEQARILQLFIDRLNLSEIILIGHDSPSGLLVVAWQPKLFKAFILTDTQIFPTDEYARIHKLLNMVGGKFFSAFNTATNFLTWGTMRFGMPTKKFTKAEKNVYYKTSRGKIRRQAPGKILRSIRTEREAMVQIKTAFESPLAQSPILLIYGSNDPLNQLGVPDRMKRMFPGSQLHIIDGEKHFPHEGQAKLMSLIIYKWLKEHNY